MREQDDMTRANRVALSADAAKKITAARGSAPARIAKLFARGPLPLQLGDSSMWQQDNCSATARVEGKGLREVFADAVDPLAEDGLIGGLLPSALASIVLSSYDADCRCTLERLPVTLLTVPRVLAHVEGCGAALSPQLAGQVARRLTMTMMNYNGQRRPLPSTQQGFADVVDDIEAKSELPAEGIQPIESDAKRSGRSVRGYARVVKEVSWAQGTKEMPLGSIIEVLVATEREQEDLRRGAGQASPQNVVIWWDGKARMMPREFLSSSTRADWFKWAKENGS